MTWLALAALLLLAVLLNARIDVLRRQLREAEEDAAEQIALLRAQVRDLEPPWRTPMRPDRFNHEPAVDRLLSGETDASERRGTS